MTGAAAAHDGAIEAALATLGVQSTRGEAEPDSPRRFPDGVAFRIEIPSVEGPACLDAVLEEAATLDVPVRRVSQGSGVAMLTDAELGRMARAATDAGIEVSLFSRPGASWGTSAGARSALGASLAPAAWGRDQLRACLEDVLRAADHGFRSVLIADVGVLAAFAELRRADRVPPDMQAKVSVMLAVANPATARVLEELGAGSINVPGDLPIPELGALRAATSVPIDVYVESPDDLGGFVRLHEAPEMIRVAAPLHLKMGLRNAPALYPWGRHLESAAIAMARERVHRARLVMELLERAGADTTTSAPGAAGLAVPVAPPA
jgi:hypothetical protein